MCQALMNCDREKKLYCAKMESDEKKLGYIRGTCRFVHP